MRLTLLNPVGRIVSLHELPDVVRLMTTRSIDHPLKVK
jgi:hypothetical protein